MVVPILLAVIGLALAALLFVRARRASQAVDRRIEEVREEMERSPQAPWAALAELMQEQNTPPAPRKAPVRKRNGEGTD